MPRADSGVHRSGPDGASCEPKRPARLDDRRAAMRDNATVTANGVPRPSKMVPEVLRGAILHTATVPELLRPAEAAGLLGIGERTLWRWSRAGIVPGLVRPTPGTVRYVRQALMEWIERGCPAQE